MTDKNQELTILMTRDGDACARFAEACQVYAAPHINCISFPLLETYNFNILLPPSTVCDKIIVTSARAISWLKRNLDKLSQVEVLCVGPQLAKEITACGYFRAQTYPQIEDLLEDKAAYDGARILYVRGVDIHTEIRAIMESVADSYTEMTVYEARQADHLPAHIHALLQEGQISYLTLFSTRAADALVRLIRTHSLEEACTRIQCLCLSDRVLKSLGSVTWKHVRVAGTPDMDGLAKALLDAGNI